jgi:ABC-type multidrug transport system fused ATPase/permease subunit
VRACDLILVLRDGVIVEQGGYAELIRRGGIFADYYNTTQFDTEDKPRGVA